MGCGSLWLLSRVPAHQHPTSGHRSGTQPNLPPACLLGQVRLSLKLVPAPPKGHVHWAKAWHLRRYQLNHLKDLEPHRGEKDLQRPSRQTLYFPFVDLSPFVILGAMSSPLCCKFHGPRTRPIWFLTYPNHQHRAGSTCWMPANTYV